MGKNIQVSLYSFNLVVFFWVWYKECGDSLKGPAQSHNTVYSKTEHWLFCFGFLKRKPVECVI